MLEILEITDVNKCGDGTDYVVAITVQDLLLQKLKKDINWTQNIDSITCHVFIENGNITSTDFSVYDGLGGWHDFITENIIDNNHLLHIQQYVKDFIRTIPQPA